MPFNLGKGKKVREAEEGEQPPTEESPKEIAGSAAQELEVEEAVEEVQTTPDQETEAEQEQASEENAEQPAGPKPSVASSFRPSFLDPVSPERPARHASRGAPYFVTVRDEAGNVSIQRFDDRKDAEAHIELLLEEGVDAGAIAVHRGLDVGYQVTRRPIVQLSNPDPQ